MIVLNKAYRIRPGDIVELDRDPSFLQRLLKIEVKTLITIESVTADGMIHVQIEEK